MQLLPLLLSSWGCLDYEDYLLRKAERECDVLTSCNPDIPCDPPEEPDPNCEYDAGAARECLNGLFVCNEDNPGFEYPVAPQVCATVCGAAF